MQILSAPTQPCPAPGPRPPAPSRHSSLHFLPFGGGSSTCWHCPFPTPPPCSPLFFQSLVPLPFRCASFDQTAPSSSDQQFPSPYRHHAPPPPPPRHFLNSCMFFTFQPQATGPDTTQWTDVLLLPAVGVLIRTGSL